MSELILKGADGANPLGFLAALGVLRTASRTWPESSPRMGWVQYANGWRPVLALEIEMTEKGFVAALHNSLRQMEDHPAFGFADNLSVPAPTFRAETMTAAADAAPDDRRYADFLAAFGSDGVIDEKTGIVADTALRTMGGAGHQHFLGTMRQLVNDTEEAHIQKALFNDWRYDDPLEKHTMRWDPADDVRHALRWRKPSGDPARKTGGGMWGANRLAVEGLPLLPTAPRQRRLETTGFTRRKGHGETWTWPIWEPKISVDTVRSLLALDRLQEAKPNRELLKRMGIVEIFRCQRLTQGKFRNFAPAAPVA